MIAGLLVSVLAFSHPVAASATPSLDEVRGKLATAGPKATVQDLAAHGRFDYVLNRIGAGDRAWVALAPKLAAGTDGGNAEGLTIALAEALPKSPRTVLAVLDLRGPVSLSPGRVCSAPFIEPKPGVVAAYKGRALRAVSAVRSAVPTGAAAACLASLKAIRD